ncbi:hypothetical protein BD324DRAFT_406453 [Kockovaella imperatae]|uniref:Uncharacterized protein n=1 Tax=Kockovaella imperatae TaxID=4999 RepID=A0A1Y1UIS5_9TREE|nr:hypothetical protein BD324DRAFT_406453 [Kockovaella imperatae]ORX37892.1 hypothetical protein BD324DRAFT_406453 [Kockovaella imperatae]
MPAEKKETSYEKISSVGTVNADNSITWTDTGPTGSRVQSTLVADIPPGDGERRMVLCPVFSHRNVPNAQWVKSQDTGSEATNDQWTAKLSIRSVVNALHYYSYDSHVYADRLQLATGRESSSTGHAWTETQNGNTTLVLDATEGGLKPCADLHSRAPVRSYKVPLSEWSNFIAPALGGSKEELESIAKYQYE